MEKIYFNNINYWKFQLLTLIFSIFFIYYGFNKSHIYYKLFSSLGYFLLSLNMLYLLFLRMNWYRNYVYWNKAVLIIRINSYFSEKSIAFKNVLKSEISDSKLKILMISSNIEIDLSKIAKQDLIRLNEIINKYAKA